MSQHAPNGDLIFTGPLNVPIAGRTDHIPLSVPGGAYVIPADVVSGMGEGNTLAGMQVLQRMFPGSHPDAPVSAGEPAPSPGVAGGMARGGHAGKHTTVPIIAAGGEFIIHPADVARIGGGNISHGHTILDSFVKQARLKTIKDITKLPGPKRS